MGAELVRHGRAALVTLDWPERRNALGPREAAALRDALADAARDPDVAGLVLSGNGAFCAGGDLAAIAELAQGGEAAVRDAVYSRFQALTRALVRFPVPTVAAVDGPAVGLGLDLALACDERFVGAGGWFRQGWAAVGLVPGAGGELLLRRLAPTLLWSLLADGRKLRGDGAQRAGLAHAVEGSALDAALARVDALGEVPRAALEGYARLHRAELAERLDRHLEECLDLQVGLLRSDEFARRASSILGGT